MLVNRENVNGSEFIQEFNKRFTSFAQKAPILISFMVTPNAVDIYENVSETERKALFTYKFKFSCPVKENIKDIKDVLLDKFYPVFSVAKKELSDYSAEELNELASEGRSAMELLDAKKEKTITEKWRVEKIITLRDEIFMRNLNENRCYRYRLKMPVTIFLKNYREAQNKDQVFSQFLAKSIFMNEIYDNYEEGKENN
jgi:hypothetical protein